jgi:hypothetical protein
MKWLARIWEELIALFIDDVSFAVAIAAWLAAMPLVWLTHLPPPAWRGPLLFAGLAVIFVENTLRRSRK